MAKFSSRVLVVDGNDFRGERLGLQLREIGLNVTSVGLGSRGRRAVGAMVMLDPAVVVVSLSALDLNAIAAISIMSFISPQTAIVAMCSSDDAVQLSVSGDIGVTCFVRPSIRSSRLRKIICSLAGWIPPGSDAEPPSGALWSMEPPASVRRDAHRTPARQYATLDGSTAGRADVPTLRRSGR